MINLKRLKATLLISGLQQKDPPLFQVINQLIDALQEFINTTTSGTSGSSGSTTTNIINNILQLINSNSNLIQDRKSDTFYMLGSSATPVIDTYAIPVTNGNGEAPEIVFDSNGDVVIVTGIPT